jgi:tryptophan 7-halogenase
MTKKINSITIVGGGTAGWLSAVYLNKVLAAGKSGPLTIRLVESEDIEIIGVGEATVPTLAHTLLAAGIPEWRFLKGADASFKHGIRFVDWLATPQDGQPPHTFFHPFEHPMVLEGFNAQTHWLRLKEMGAAVPPLHEATSVQSALAEALRSPKQFTDRAYLAPVPYAFHLDAVKFARMLREIGIERGVQHVVDDVVGVNLDESGSIASLETKKSGVLESDFFVDCTGFYGLLIEKSLREPFISFSDTLLCDSAVALQLPHGGDPPRIRPYTTSTAKSAGWIWEIDLFSRRGNGYVYSSRHQSDDEATSVLLSHLGVKESQATPRHLKMRVGYRRRSWVKNCVAIGLSCGFIEPLESTGIYLIEHALWMLADYIATGDGAPVLARQFNHLLEKLYLELHDFVQLHYVLTMREDTKFWADCKNEIPLSDALRSKLEMWQYKLPGAGDLDGKLSLFGPANYFYIMAGMRHLPAFGANITPYIDPAASMRVLDVIKSAREHALKVAADHLDVIRNLRSKSE